MEDPRVRRLKILLLVSSLVCLAFLLLAAFEENFTAEWRGPQEEYARLLLAKTGDVGGDGQSYPIELRQVFLKDWSRVDRCVSCHVGIDNPAFRNGEQPLTAHPGNLLDHHPVDKFGCTICHQGQGTATDKDGAHGRVPNWNQPLLVGDLVQSTCAQCHHEVDVSQAPALSQGQHRLADLGCAGCHVIAHVGPQEKVGPPLSRTGSKVSRQWLGHWLANPRSYLPKAKMPRYDLPPEAVQSLAAYLMTFRDPVLDSMPEPKGDYDAGNTVFREAQCIVCHVTKEDFKGNPVGGTIGPDLRKIGNKDNQRWLTAFFKNPHGFLQPNTKMPGYHFTDAEAANLAQFAVQEWIDTDLRDSDAKEPQPPVDSAARVQQGKLLFKELGCAGCHDLTPQDSKLAAADLTNIGSRPVHALDFGDAHIGRTLSDFLYTKLKSPTAFRRDFRPLTWDQSAVAVWQNLRPAALYSDSMPLVAGSESQRLAWILRRTQDTGTLDASLRLPEDAPQTQAAWLVQELNMVGALSPLKMPDFQLSDEDAKAVTIGLLSHSEMSIPSKRYEVAQETTTAFNPKDRFGVLERHDRCLSCHSIRGAGDRQASDLTYEGSRVNRQWLNNYLNKPYSMRRTLTIAMPIFHFLDEDARFMADYMSLVFVDAQIGAGWERGRALADAARGQALFQAKGCIACHQLNGTGGDVGPSLTTQVPEFPQGTWVGDKLQGGWIYQWLLNPQSLVPDTLEPNLGLSDQEALDLTAYLLTLKSPDFQDRK